MVLALSFAVTPKYSDGSLFPIPCLEENGDKVVLKVTNSGNPQMGESACR